MFRQFTMSLTLVAACALGQATVAQDSSEAGAQSTTPATLASYGRNYAGCSDCGTSGNGSYNYGAAMGYAGPAMGGVGGPGGPQAMAYGGRWGGAAANRDCDRFYHYPYVYYPQNFRGSEYYQSSDSLYNRYPPEMQIPVYNKHWHNYYPSSRRYHWGHHFILDVF